MGDVTSASQPSKRGRGSRLQARRNQWAIAGIVAVLISVSFFVVWSPQATAEAAARAANSSAVSDDFAQAAAAVAAEESLGRKYRLEPGPDVRARYESAAADALVALRQGRADGGKAEAELVDQVLVLHRSYLDSIDRMFAAVDRGDAADVLRIDAEEVDPSFEVIQRLVANEAVAEHAVAVASLDNLQRLEGLHRKLIPGVFLLGLVLVALLASVTRGYRTLLDSERAGALYDSLHDALTGLPNRTLLTDRLYRALEEGLHAGSTTGLLLIDLDRFKEVNDTFGHHYGDELLAKIGPRLRAHVRQGDTIARLGGDEFAVLLPGVGDRATAVVIADALQHALEVPFQVAGVDLDVEASIGIVLSGEHGDDTTTLLQRVDIAMYVAKAEHLGVFVYDPDADSHSPGKLALLGELRRAIENDELLLHFQPQVSIDTGEVTGAEALVRWQHPTRGLVYPDDFVPLAERTGLIGPLTGFVLNAAVIQAKAWSDAGQPLPVAVNLSVRNLSDEDLPRQVAALLKAHQLPASLLKLEVTESAIMFDPVGAARVLRQLADLGVEISIDDFGAGYTSLGQLKSLPVTEFKIDKSFVMNMNQDASDALIVHSVVDLGHHLGLTIVAEGVENPAALEQLAAYGCDNAQGYYLCRPVPVDAFDDWRSDYVEGIRLGAVPSTELETTANRA
ncbi:putative bifunctional diguanylate cyclase/phosphodiesterase [Demequina lutea]|uniref:Diguanylate cyclase (GGDEF)-like protein n=1 Tax=Demequina lutea TaxID=431489 RepID=A0A7Z0CJT8_9MICO|nr:EAL domain-containing protein [Demequina lutea]NYI41233.1 diguanylate cyclase (GGDEF)-like protein [Demequina lutea]